MCASTISPTKSGYIPRGWELLTGAPRARACCRRLRDCVERAARLLRETDESCAGIALEAGFRDQSHMSRVFRRVLGRSPSVVREDRREFR